MTIRFLTICAAALACALAVPAEAASIRTFVASTGLDTNTTTNCARAAPCRTFAAAYTVTAPSGEIVALDTIAYCPLTITGPLTIVGDGAAAALCTATAGVPGITVNAGATDKVSIRGLQVSGGDVAGTVGLAVASGHLVLERSALRNLATGLSIAAGASADVADTDIVANGTGVAVDGLASIVGGHLVGNGSLYSGAGTIRIARGYLAN